MKKFCTIIRRTSQWELLLIMILMFAYPSICEATTYGTNLVTHGNADNPSTFTTDWSVTNGSHFVDATSASLSSLIRSGNTDGYVFDYYLGSSGVTTEYISKTIDISDISITVATGNVKAVLSGYVFKKYTADVSRIKLEQLDASNGLLVTTQDENNGSNVWQFKTITVNNLNTLTRKLKITLYATLSGTEVATNLSDSYVEFDGIDLELYCWPSVTNTAASSITTNSAVLAGNVTTDGNPANTERGVVYSTTNTNPTIGGANVTKVAIGSGSGIFSTTLSGLSGAQIYYYNAYATNTLGTVYGTVNNFTTVTPTVTTAVTNAASGIGITGATLNGAINANNHSAVVTFQYGLTTSYGTTVTADQSPVTGSAGTSVSKTISGLASSTLYHYKVVAVNTDGTTSGLDQSFTTATPVPEMDLKQSSTAIADGGSYDFGTKLLSSNTDIVFTIQNSGTSALTLTTPITIGGTNADQFSIQAQPTSSIAAAGSTTFTIRFSPTSTGSKSASISIGNNDSNENPYDLTITGQGYAAPTVTTSVQTINTQGVNVSTVLVPMTITTLKGSVNANNASTTVTFEYGTTTAYGTSVTATGSPVAGTSVTSVTCTPTLLPNTTYHYRVVGTNSGGTTYGADQTFTTPVIEHFTDETTDYAQTFTEGGTTFTMTGYLFDKYDPLGGYEGPDCFYDAQMINNLYNVMPSAGIVGSITNATNNFYVNNFWIAPGNAAYTFGQYGNVIIRGKRSGTTLFTYTLTSANTNNTSANNYYSFIDLSSYNSILIDELEFEVTDNIRYLKIDAFNFNYPSAFASTVTTQAVNSIGATTATGNGNITNLGNPNPTAYGVCWSTTSGAETATGSHASNGSVSATGAFTTSMTGLTANTPYYVKAYATNIAGTVYGSEVTFTTSAIAPTVTTQAVSNIGSTNAIGNGNITNLGNPNPTAYGICWGASANPTTSNSNVDKGTASATGAFTAQIIGLTAGTTYHARAFATNTQGTSYGDDVTFTTTSAMTEPGNALAFDGTNDFVAVPFATTSLTSFTIETWINPATIPGSGSIAILNTNAWDATNGGIHFQFENGHVELAVFELVSGWPTMSTMLSTNKWQHIAVVYDGPGGAVKFYLNGILDNTVSKTLPATKISAAEIGAWTSERYFNGKLDEFRVWNTARSESEIKADMDNSISASTSGLIGYYNFNEGTAGGSNTAGSTILPDLTSNGNNGTLTNFARTGTTSNWVESYAMVVPISTAATSTTASGFTANWTAPVTGTLNNYLLEVATDAAFTSLVSGYNPKTVTSSSTSSSVTGLSTYVTYYYRVRADKTSLTGQGDYSNGITVQTLPIAPTVTTQAVSSITATTATGNGNITSLGVPNPTAYGVCWNTGGTPTISDSKVDNGAASATGAFTASINGLNANTTYHVRAFATNTAGTSYGTEVTFTTSAIASTVTTQAVSSITATSAIGNGNITSLGVPNPTAYGVCWNTGGTPTTSDSKVDNGAASATGAFTASIAGLTANTTYHVRAYATSTAGTSYGSELSFTTSTIAPTAASVAASSISSTAATLNGTVNANNATSVVTFDYGTSISYGSSATATQSPVAGTSVTSVSTPLTGLTPNTTYYFRVKAVNAGGTTYGVDGTFTTLAIAPTAASVAASSISGTAAILNGTINANNASTTVTFEYGLNTSYGTTVTADQSPVTGGTATSVSKAITGLTAGVTYYYRVVGVNVAGTTNGLVQSFTTPLLVGNGTPADPYQIATLADLKWVSEHSDIWNSSFIQTANIDASITSTWNISKGFSPIGNITTTFTGNYNGQNHTITGLTINRSNEYNVGLFGATANAILKNIALLDCSVIGQNNVGGLVGQMGYNSTLTSSISDCYCTGNVSGTDYVSGLVGVNKSSSITNSYSACNVTATTNAAGLVSFNMNSTIANCFYDSNTSGQSDTGKGTPKTTAEMKTQSTFTGWDFAGETANGTTDIWAISSTQNNGYPCFVSQITSSVASTVTTQAITGIATTTATGNGNITGLGVPNPGSHGVCWGTSANPTIIDNTVANIGGTSATGAFTAPITGLIPNTLYHVRAYATNSTGTVYGTDASFTTKMPTITSATYNASTGVLVLTCLNINNNDIISPAKMTLTGEGGMSYSLTTDNVFASGSISASITLNATDKAAINQIFNKNGTSSTGATTYNLAAADDWDTSISAGDISDLTGNGIVVSNLASPTVTTQAVSDITAISATGNGNITSMGVPNPTQYGVVWSTSPNPTVDLTTKTTQGAAAATGVFASSITGLTPSTTYYVKAYATNIVGTSYGAEVSFMSSDIVPDAPTAVLATGGNGQAIVSFTAPASNGGTSITGYTVTSSPGGLTGTGTASPIVVNGLTNGTAYTFTVTATNSAGSGAASTTSNNVSPSLTVQTITFNALPTKTYGDIAYSLDATSDAGLAISYASNNTAVASVSGNTVTIVGAGTANITASQAGNAAYAAAANVVQQLIVNKKAVTVTATTDTKTYDGTTVSAAVPTVGALATGDAINVAPTQAFDNATVGTTHVLTASGLILKNGSTDVTSNYDISYATATGTINKLGVIVAAVADTKTYDGTTVSAAVPTVGALATGDAINVAPTQIFDNATVGTTHVLAASGLILKNGSADVTSNYDISYATATGSVIAKPLTITAPTVTLSKVYDGNAVAIVSAGTLLGVVAGDAGKVTVAAAASYDNANIEPNKTITVVYTLGGSAVGNYSAPANFVATGAEISSGGITLEPLSNPTQNQASTGLVLSYNVVAGGPTQYHITYEARALAVGMQDVSYTALVTTGTSGSISISVPAGTRPGKYKGSLQMRNDSGVESSVYNFELTVNIPTEYIVVKYNRLLVLDNSTKIFIAYQWYKDGVAIEGATKQFYSDPKGLVGTYSMKGTTGEGEVLYSYPKVLNIPLAQKVAAYPSLVRANQTCTVEITDGALELNLTGAELSVYSSQGVRVYYSTKVEKLNTVKLPMMDGMYSGRLTTADGQSFLFKVIVAN
jgi:hypothetical protein